MIVSPIAQRALLTAGAIVILAGCSSPTATNSQASVGSLTTVDYAKRLGVAVRTASRTCVTTRDQTLQSGSPITLVLPLSPQRYLPAQISGPSPEACPITQEIAPGSVSYEISVTPSTDLPKLTPLFAVIGTPESGAFAMDNFNVQADIDQSHSRNSFRACGANDGVYLTVWRGVPINGTRLWAGHYYETGAPGILPSCTPAEMQPL